eukprot:363126-Chlamydomonas_euryale.AAC.2
MDKERHRLRNRTSCWDTCKQPHSQPMKTSPKLESSLDGSGTLPTLPWQSCQSNCEMLEQTTASNWRRRMHRPLSGHKFLRCFAYFGGLWEWLRLVELFLSCHNASHIHMQCVPIGVDAAGVVLPLLVRWGRCMRATAHHARHIWRVPHC